MPLPQGHTWIHGAFPPLLQWAVLATRRARQALCSHPPPLWCAPPFFCPLAGSEGSFLLKFWANGKPPKRMYLMEGCREFVRRKALKAGCHLAFYATPDRRFVS